MLKPHVRILIVAALCVAALIGLVVREGMARAGGQEVLLAMQPVDPRSLLGGHYVIVSLHEDIPPGAPCPATLDQSTPAQASSSLPRTWLALAPNGRHHSVAGMAQTRAGAEKLGPIVVRGAAACFAPELDPADPQRTGFITTFIGVDRFHIAQAEALRIEQLLRDQNTEDGPPVFAIVSIGADGRARLSGLEAEGERLMLGWR
ncbi:MAG: GDYXXLXY domain-containing protein [Terricaulis sp.]|nr:GDYXXLXY domain-containing protein [Terricaulis sp.]